MELTPREQQVVCILAAGATNREIAARLGVREQTIKNRLSVLYRKLGLRNRLELAVYAAGCTLIDLASRDRSRR